MAAPALDLARIDAEFPYAREAGYFNTAAEGLLPRSGREALLRYADDKARGERGRAAMYATETRLRERAAQRIAARPDQVTFLPSAARGVGVVLEAIDWQPGDNVVTGEAEFPSNVLGPLALGRRGVETRIVRSPGGRYAYDVLERLVDGRTRLVIASAVSFRTGFRVDIARVAAAAHAAGALLLVDATQAFGVVPVSLAPADVLVASTFKWALAVHGAAVFAVADSAGEIEPAMVGWRGVRDLFAPDRFERYEPWPMPAGSTRACPLSAPNTCWRRRSICSTWSVRRRSRRRSLRTSSASARTRRARDRDTGLRGSGRARRHHRVRNAGP